MGSILSRIILGIGIALLDYYWSRRQRRKIKDLEKGKRCLQSIEFLLEHETRHGSDYAQALRDVKYYLAGEGYLRSNSNWIKGIVDSFTKFAFRERINNLGYIGLLVVACFLEVIYDLLFGFYYATSVEGNGALTAILSNVIHIPALWIGLLLGQNVRHIVRWMFSDPEELKIHKTIKELVLATPILKLVTEYKPEASIDSVGLDDLAMGLSNSGKKIMKKLQQSGEQIAQQAKKAVEAVADYQENREKQIAEDKEKRKEQFEDLTKGR